MDRPKLEVADIFRRYGEAYRQKHGASLSNAQRRVMTAIEVCRTAALGGHLEHCDSCPYERNAYDSCRNRHCPSASPWRVPNGSKNEKRKLSRLRIFMSSSPPEPIAAMAYQNKDVVYGILFRATAETLSTIAADPEHLGAEIGFFAVLHSWGQNLFFIPTCIVSSRAAGSHSMVVGGFLAVPVSSCRTGVVLPVSPIVLDLSGGGFRCRQTQVLLFPRGPSRSADFRRHLDPVRHAKWVVYAKAPFAGPSKVVDYVGRYTHRSRFPIIGSWISKTGRSSSNGGLPRQQSAENYASLGRGVHPTIPAPCSAQWIPPHSLLRVPGQSIPQREAKALPPTPGLPPTNPSSSQPQPDEDYRDRYEKLTVTLCGMPGLPCGRMITVKLLAKVVLPDQPGYLMIDPPDYKSLPPLNPKLLIGGGCCLPSIPITLRSAKHVHHSPLVLAQTHELSPPVRSHSFPTVCSPNSELPLAIQNP